MVHIGTTRPCERAIYFILRWSANLAYLDIDTSVSYCCLQNYKSSLTSKIIFASKKILVHCFASTSHQMDFENLRQREIRLSRGQ